MNLPAKMSKPRSKNPCSKRVTPENAYEVWQTPDGDTTYYVLKKHQTPEREGENPYAMWFVNARSPRSARDGDNGDMYAVNVMADNIKIDNPLATLYCVTPATVEYLHDLKLDYRMTSLASLDPRLVSYVRIAIPKAAVQETLGILKASSIRVVCDPSVEHYIDACVSDVLSTEKEE